MPGEPKRPERRHTHLTSVDKLLRQIERGWYRPALINHLLLPLSWLYCALAALHRWSWSGFPRRPQRAGAPVVVVGNLTAGGTGKTPLVVALARQLGQRGYRPGIISRGYGGSVGDTPHRVRDADGPDKVGDEAVLLCRRSGAPVVVGADRVAASRQLVESQGCDVIVSDDGLQHYRLHRDVAVVVIDGSRGFGSGWCLPAGPLREPLSALDRADIRISNGPGVAADFVMTMAGAELRAVNNPGVVSSLSTLLAQPVHAVAGTGNPERFFQQLESAGLRILRHPFPDHHAYVSADFDFADDDSVIVMTEKDAVKCENLAIAGSVFYLSVEAELDPAFFDRVEELVSQCHDG